MRGLFGALAASLALTAAASFPAQADGIDKESIMQSLEMQGYSVSEFQPNMVAVEVGDFTILVGVFGPDSDISYVTYPTGVTANEVSYKFLSNFNRDVKFGRAYIDRDGDVTLQMDRNASGGISIRNIESDFDVFLLLVDKFMNDISRTGSV
ncbi:MAG: YbjN domain-containing protein [Pseudomonadota bacterium]